MLRLKSSWILIVVVLVIIALSRCNTTDNSPAEELVYLNHSDTVDYVGINTCRQCHAEIYNSFIETGMGSSFHEAFSDNSVGDFSGQVLTDTFSNLNYYPFWLSDSLWLKEFRIKGGDTVHNLVQPIDFIVGSGQHTNSHMYVNNGYLYQAPFTWYAQEGKLDLPPGFENGANNRFSRKIGLECTSCHNAMPTGFVMGSINKYQKVPSAIDCERCHGPGEVHVQRMQAGLIVDTANEIDYSIVNIGKLAPELQFEACQRCHLQGNSVLAEGRSFQDFKPGMHLKEVMDVYLPRYSNAEDDFIMASHADRFKQSKCLIDNQSFNCTSCHNPHVSVRSTKIEKFNLTCAQCHGREHETMCTADQQQIMNAENNCVGCHMPVSTSIDIPHVSIHDHRIQVPGKKATKEDVKKFLGLMAVNNSNPSARSKVLAYLQQFERFTPRKFYLDSAAYFIDRLDKGEEKFKFQVYQKYLAEEYEGILELVNNRGVEESLEILSLQSYDNFDAWTAYRIAEAGRKVPGGVDLAELFLERAIELMPYNPDLGSKYSSILLQQGRKVEAESLLKEVLEEHPNQVDALNNQGFLYLTNGRFYEAKKYFRKAVNLDPDYELAWLNLASVCIQLNELTETEKALEQALRINPQNLKARSLFQNIKSQN